MYRYDRNVVLAAFRAEHPDDLRPKEKTLTDFDVDLFNIYDKEIRKQAVENEIPIDEFIVSILVLFANLSTAKTEKTRVSHACKFFNAVRPQRSVVIAPPEPHIASGAPTGGPV